MRPLLLVASLLLVAMPFVTSSEESHHFQPDATGPSLTSQTKRGKPGGSPSEGAHQRGPLRGIRKVWPSRAFIKQIS